MGRKISTPPEIYTNGPFLGTFPVCDLYGAGAGDTRQAVSLVLPAQLAPATPPLLAADSLEVNSSSWLSCLCCLS